MMDGRKLLLKASEHGSDHFILRSVPLDERSREASIVFFYLSNKRTGDQREHEPHRSVERFVVRNLQIGDWSCGCVADIEPNLSQWRDDH